jgi:broad specificity phosphatase PhoE
MRTQRRAHGFGRVPCALRARATSATDQVEEHPHRGSEGRPIPTSIHVGVTAAVTRTLQPSRVRCPARLFSVVRGDRPISQLSFAPVTPTRVLLMRHAEVENPHGILYGFLPGFPLSARGRAQAAAVGQSLRDSGVRRILHSPLDRARETAEIVNDQLPERVPLIVEPALREADFSRYLQGAAFWQIPIRRPRWFAHKLRRGALPDDESIEALGGRVLGVVNRLAREHPAEVSLCVSHADPLQAAWVLLDGRPQTEREMARKQVGRAGIVEVDLEEGHLLKTRYLPAPKVSPASLIS